MRSQCARVHFRDWATQGRYVAKNHRVALGIRPKTEDARRLDASTREAVENCPQTETRPRARSMLAGERAGG
jgi:hypothetical protein